jgi:hypothetical protein
MPHFPVMTKIEPARKTERRASRGMIFFVLTLAALAAVLTSVYVLGMHPGDTTSL